MTWDHSFPRSADAEVASRLGSGAVQQRSCRNAGTSPLKAERHHVFIMAVSTEVSIGRLMALMLAIKILQ